MTVEVQEQRKTIIKLKIELLKTMNIGTEQGMRECWEKPFVKAKSGRCSYIETVDSKLAGIVYKVRERLEFYVTMEALEL